MIHSYYISGKSPERFATVFWGAVGHLPLYRRHSRVICQCTCVNLVACHCICGHGPSVIQWQVVLVPFRDTPTNSLMAKKHGANKRANDQAPPEFVDDIRTQRRAARSQIPGRPEASLALLRPFGRPKRTGTASSSNAKATSGGGKVCLPSPPCPN